MTIHALLLAAIPLSPFGSDPPQFVSLDVSDVQRDALDTLNRQLYRSQITGCSVADPVLDAVQDHAGLVRAPVTVQLHHGEALIDTFALTSWRMGCRWDDGDRARAWEDAAWIVEMHAALRADDHAAGWVLVVATELLNGVLWMVEQAPEAHLPLRLRAALAGPVASDRERADQVLRACLTDHEVMQWSQSPAWMGGAVELNSALDWLSMPLFVQLYPRVYARGVSVCAFNHAAALGEDEPALVPVGPLGTALGMGGLLEPGEASMFDSKLDETLARVDARRAAYLARQRGAPSR